MDQPRVSLSREDFFWAITLIGDHPGIMTDAERARFQRIVASVETQPYPKPAAFDVYVVHVPYSGDAPIAVRTNVEDARTLGRVYNLNRADTHAEVLGYTLDSVGASAEAISLD